MQSTHGPVRRLTTKITVSCPSLYRVTRIGCHEKCHQSDSGGKMICQRSFVESVVTMKIDNDRRYGVCDYRSSTSVMIRLLKMYQLFEKRATKAEVESRSSLKNRRRHGEFGEKILQRFLRDEEDVNI